ncbi:MAG: MlaD family protein [Candidatus Omnitrophica bacterium]|nr:MlaD family protein [Candidatus Omnitrophota bacterium]
MTKRLTIEMKVGLFVLCGILAVIIFIFTQTKTRKLRGYEINVLFDYVSGLEIGSPVRVSGVRVGEVKKIEILYENIPKVMVKLKINPEVKIAKGSKITIRTLGIIGEKYIEITPSNKKEFIAKGEIVEGENPLSVEKIANIGQDIAENLNKILSNLSEIIEDKKFKQNIKNFANELDITIVKIGSLVDDLSQTNNSLKNFIEKNSPRIEDFIKNTNEFFVSGKEEIKKTAEDIRNFLEIKDKAEDAILNFSETLNDFQKVSKQAGEFLERIQREGLIAKIMKEEKMIEDIKEEISLLKETTFKIGQSSEILNETLTNLNSILNTIKSGEGTIGKLMYKDELYNEIFDFVKDIKEHPWKLFFRKK